MATVSVSFAPILAASRLAVSRWLSTSIGTDEDEGTFPINDVIRSRLLRSPSCKAELSTKYYR